MSSAGRRYPTNSGVRKTTPLDERVLKGLSKRTDDASHFEANQPVMIALSGNDAMLVSASILLTDPA
jgi:hypothetical protein